MDLYSASSCRTSKALRYGPCVTRGSQFYLPPTHKPYLPLLPSRKASPPFGRYQLVLLGEQRHTGVRNLPRVSTPRARLRLEPTTSLSQVQYSTDSTTTPSTSTRNSVQLSDHSQCTKHRHKPLDIHSCFVVSCCARRMWWQVCIPWGLMNDMIHWLVPWVCCDQIAGWTDIQICFCVSKLHGVRCYPLNLGLFSLLFLPIWAEPKLLIICAILVPFSMICPDSSEYENTQWP